jgi:hypothetical protein
MKSNSAPKRDQQLPSTPASNSTSTSASSNSSLASSASALARASASASSSQANTAIEVSDNDEDNEEDEKSNKKAKVIALVEDGVLPSLDEITRNTLKTFMNYGKGSNPPYRCPIPDCNFPYKSSAGSGRMVKHAENHASDSIVWKKMIALHKREQWDDSTSDAMAKKIVRPDVVQTTLDKFSVNTLQKDVQKALARFALETCLPLLMTESPALHEFMDEIMNASRRATSHQLHVKANQLLTSRKTFTPECDKVAASEWSEFANPAIEEAALYGVTLQQDGRSNINRDPLIATGVQGYSKFIPLGTMNAGSQKKDSDFIFNLAKRYLNNDDLGRGFGHYIFGWTLDGAAANISALRQGEEDLFLIVCRCQSHALALLLKKIFLKVFGDLIEKATKLINFVRHHSRVNSFVKEKSGKVIFRFVETRFNTHALALERLKEVRPKLAEALSQKEYKDYAKGLPPAGKADEKEVTSLLADATFWEELDFALAVTLPITVALRLMDKTNIRARHAHKVWANLGAHLATVLLDAAWSAVEKTKKRKIFALYAQQWDDAHYPVMGAAYFLDPANLAEIREMSKKKEDGDDFEDYDDLISDTQHCIELVIRRKWAGLNEEEIEAKVVKAKQGLDHYIAGSDEFKGRKYDEAESVEGWWTGTRCLLAGIAKIILFIAVTISDVERLHKVYSIVHTPARNRLRDDRVDRFALSNLAMREKRKSSKPEVTGRFDDWFAFTNLSEEVLDDLLRWTQTMMAADRQTRASLNVSGGSEAGGQASGVPSVDVDNNESLEAENVTSEADAEAASEEDCALDVSDDSAGVEATNLDDANTASRVEGVELRRSSRRVRFTERFRNAASALEINEAFFTRTT